MYRLSLCEVNKLAHADHFWPGINHVVRKQKHKYDCVWFFRGREGRGLLSLKNIPATFCLTLPLTTAIESSCLVSWRCLWGIAHQKSKPFPFTLLWQAGSMSAFAGLCVCGCVISCLCCGCSSWNRITQRERKVWSAGGGKETEGERLIALWLTQESWKCWGPRRGCHSSGSDMHHHCCYYKARSPIRQLFDRLYSTHFLSSSLLHPSKRHTLEGSWSLVTEC